MTLTIVNQEDLETLAHCVQRLLIGSSNLISVSEAAIQLSLTHTGVDYLISKGRLECIEIPIGNYDSSRKQKTIKLISERSLMQEIRRRKAAGK
jgi:hypothetical protein